MNNFKNVYRSSIESIFIYIYIYLYIFMNIFIIYILCYNLIYYIYSKYFTHTLLLLPYPQFPIQHTLFPIQEDPA